MSIFTTRSIDTFRTNVLSVNELARFDRVILDIAIDGIEKVATTLLEEHKLYNVSRIPHNRALALRNVQKNDSLKAHYEAMFNQCVVLLVSYFGSALHDLFRDAAKHAFLTHMDVPATREEIKIAWRDFVGTTTENAEAFTDLLIAQRDISFQDMQSIARAFTTHFEIHIQRTATINDIILGQAARHVIVHNAAVINDRMLKQLSGATDRHLKPQLSAGEKISFTPEEINALGSVMMSYLEDVERRLRAKFDPEQQSC
jgi:hypothetical protein